MSLQACNNNTVELVKSQIKKSVKLINVYRWIIDAYISDFFTDGLWDRLPEGWTDGLSQLDSLDLAFLLDSSLPIPNRKDLPLTLLAFRESTQALSLDRQKVDLENRGIGEGLFPSDEDKERKAVVSPHSGVTTQTKARADIQFGQYLPLNACFRKHVKPKKQHEILQLGKAIQLLGSRCSCDHVVDVGAGQGHLSRLLAFGHGFKVTTVEAAGCHAPKAQKMDKDIQKKIHRKLKRKHQTEQEQATTSVDGSKVDSTACNKTSLPDHVTCLIQPGTSAEKFLEVVRDSYRKQTNVLDIEDQGKVPNQDPSNMSTGSRSPNSKMCSKHLKSEKINSSSQTSQNIETDCINSPVDSVDTKTTQPGPGISCVSDKDGGSHTKSDLTRCSSVDMSQSRSPLPSDQSKSRSPVLENRSKSRSPVLGNRSKSRSPVLGNRSKSRSPVLGNRSKSRSPVLGNRSKSRSPVLENRSKSRSPVLGNRSKSRSPVLGNRSKSRSPVLGNRSKSRSPVLRDRSKSRSPVLENRSKSRSPVLGNRSKSRSPVLRDRSKSRSPVLRDRSKSRSPVPRNQTKSPVPSNQYKSRSPVPVDLSQFVLTGLHACGDLTPTMLRIFAQCPDIVGVASVACCYMKLSCREGEADDDSGDLGYPMSQFTANLKDNHLSFEARAMACHFADSYKERLLANPPSLKLHCYRAALQYIIKEVYPDFNQGSIRLSIKHSDTMSFESYVKTSLRRLGLDPDVPVQVLQQAQSYLPYWQNVVAFYTLRLSLAPVVESLILLDRMLYLYEQGIPSVLLPIFDPALSPRNFVLLASRKCSMDITTS